MARWKLTLEYEGSAFLGWQRQKRGRTVQGVLEQALTTFCGEPVEVVGQGRTDRGVHAARQVAHVDLTEPVETFRLTAAMRGLLPADLAVIDAVQVPDIFHARFHALSRIYRYRIAVRPVPMQRRLCWVTVKSFDPELLHNCAEIVCGEHDFTNFAKVSGEPEENRRCTVTASEWTRENHIWSYTIEGNRFLRHMVRRLVGTMHQVAGGTLTPEDFRDLLDGGHPAEPKGHAAPPEGLSLMDVTYPPLAGLAAADLPQTGGGF